MAAPLEVAVDLDNRPYPIHIGPGLLHEADTLLAKHTEGRHVIIISDAAIAKTHGRVLERSLGRVARKVAILPVKGGEGAKSMGGYARLMNRLLACRVDRSTLLVALGGGVIGDLAGFAAATLLRGVDYIQAPTTLLAQVDSAVGGKTGINTAQGKNLIGAFYQPRAVLADTDTLTTLAGREMRGGYAEVVKYGLLGDADFFARLETDYNAILGGDAAILGQTIAHCCRTKAAIVAEDEHEGGRRAVLNLGHTFGHAYEAEAGYDGSVLHGEAIAAGMADAFRLANRLGYSGAADLGRVCAHLAAAGLPTSRGALSPRLAAASPARLLGHMRGDKKARGEAIVLIIPHGIGDARIDSSVEVADIMAVLEGREA